VDDYSRSIAAKKPANAAKDSRLRSISQSTESRERDPEISMQHTNQNESCDQEH
jgi:hypothetical protein